MMHLIAIPALGCDARLYAGIAPHLPADVAVTSVIADGDTLSLCVSQVLARAPDRFVVLGTSFGGRVALELALAAPERVAGLVVIGAGPGPVADPRGGVRRVERLRGGEFDLVVSEMAAIISHLPGPHGPSAREAFTAMCRAQGVDIMARQAEALAKRTDLWPRLSEIECPALMLWGVHDQFSPAADGLRMSAGVRRGRYVELAECGHLPSLEYPEETAAAIAHWIADFRLAAT
jgi:pimeloyl-ACP methyl ester carboxylesterase